MKHLLCTFFFFALGFSGIQSQSVGINNDGSAPHPSAILDVKSNSQGVLFPRMGETARLAIVSPVEGLIVWDTTQNSIYGYDGTQWRDLSSKWKKDGNNIVNANSANIGIGAASTGASLYIRKPAPSIWLYDEGRPATSGAIQGDSNNLEVFASRVFTILGDNPGHLILQPDKDFGQYGILRAGNVGIGKDNPSYKLTLNGNMGFYDGSTFYGSIKPYENQMLINARFGTLFGLESQDIIMQTNTSGGFSYPGNVGIGVSDPLAKLHVSSTMMIGSATPAAGYALSVDGKIMAEEMRIEDSAGWPDYVFKDDYTLPTLEELKISIGKYGHLPGIPSAKEVESEGILVGDMQKRQMEKIEENTLYILQLHEHINGLEKQVKELSALLSNIQE